MSRRKSVRREKILLQRDHNSFTTSQGRRARNATQFVFSCGDRVRSSVFIAQVNALREWHHLWGISLVIPCGGGIPS